MIFAFFLSIRLFTYCDCFQEYSRLRALSYPSASLFVVFFSVVSRTSFDNVQNKWLPEIHHHNPGTPFILVGSKTDLRIPGNDEHISSADGKTMARKTGAEKYVEISSLKGSNVQEVINSGISCLFSSSSQAKKSAKGGCHVL